ncbi:hypothetical protein ABZ759_27115 [Streptomyces sp. NPDC047860]|uniref:hypothetical protein n=1 Tax=Streptomyces sp. NPDC047860 TaxID=3155743 RepID=UPI0033DD1357
MVVSASPASISTRRFAAPALWRTISLLWRSADNSPLIHTARSMLQQAFARAPQEQHAAPRAS